jgi:hypothetical protein
MDTTSVAQGDCEAQDGLEAPTLSCGEKGEKG